MRYGEIITRALNITWSHKYLWLLALFAGEGTASFSSFSFTEPSTSGRATNATPSQVWSAVTGWIGAHVLLVVLGAAAILVFSIAVLLLSAIADGALVRGSAEHDREQPFSLGRAWSSGLATFWPVLKVKLLAVLVALVSIAIIGGLVALAVASALSGVTAATVILATAAILLGLVAIPFSIVFSVLILLMVRQVVLGGRQDTGAALGQTLALMGRRLGRVALLWLLSIVLGIAIGIGLGLVTIILLGIVVGLVLVVYFAAGLTAAVVAGIVLGVPWFVVLLIAAGAINAYTSTFWTLGYTRLDLEPQPQVAIFPPTAA